MSGEGIGIPHSLTVVALLPHLHLHPPPPPPPPTSNLNPHLNPHLQPSTPTSNPHRYPSRPLLTPDYWPFVHIINLVDFLSGDVMIVPESWGHGVLNIQQTVAVATEGVRSLTLL